MFRKFLPLSALGGLIICLGTTGCETTGDPNRGGIFWSETKAQDRLHARQQELNALNRGTAAVDAENRRLQARERALADEL